MVPDVLIGRMSLPLGGLNLDMPEMPGLYNVLLAFSRRVSLERGSLDQIPEQESVPSGRKRFVENKKSDSVI